MLCGVLLIPVEVQCEYAGIFQQDYYTDLERTLAVCRDYPARFKARTGYHPRMVYRPPVTAYEGVAAMGGDLVFPRDHQPMLRNQGHIVPTPEILDSLRVPDPWQDARFVRHSRWYRELLRRFPQQVEASLAGQEGPVTTAGLLRGQEFFRDCIQNPPLAHRLLTLCTEMFITWHRAADGVIGLERQTIGIADDYAGLLHPRLWPEFVLPYYRQIISSLGPRGCHLHTELVRREHLAPLRQLDLRSINFSEDQYLTIGDVQEMLPDVPFGWHILTVQEMQQGSPVSIQDRCRQITESGVDEVRCELTVNTPPENVRAFVRAIQEMGGQVV